jgi:hypothetical protein
MRSADGHRHSVRGLRVVSGLAAVTAAAGLLVGCGGSGSQSTETVSMAQLRAAKRAGEEKAREQDRVKNLQKQMRQLKHRVNHGAHAHSGATASASPAVAPPAATSTQASAEGAPVRTFHAPSGNVSCQILVDGASCTVESIGETFVFEAGGPARIEPTAALPRGLGELVGYGNTVGAGSIICGVPPSDIPRGITCSDASTGHGFEASSVSSRQSAY